MHHGGPIMGILVTQSRQGEIGPRQIFKGCRAEWMAVCGREERHLVATTYAHSTMRGVRPRK
jgi:hypothetical protein